MTEPDRANLELRVPEPVEPGTPCRTDPDRPDWCLTHLLELQFAEPDEPPSRWNALGCLLLGSAWIVSGVIVVLLVAG